MKTTIFALGLFLASCGTASKSNLSEEGQPSSDKSYAGVIIVSEFGEETSKIDVLTRMTAYEDKNLIIEKSVHVDRDDAENPDFYESSIKVDGSKMTIVEKDGKYKGSGEFLDGTAWDHTKSKTKVRTDDDLDLETTLTLKGGKIGFDQVLSEDDEELFTMKGTLEEISNEEFEKRYKELSK